MSQPTPSRADLSVFISADMEGVAGVVTGEQLGPAGFEYGRFRELMTEEVLAAIEGARSAGATRIVVADAHGNGQNLLVERPEARTVRFRADTMPEIARFLQFILNDQPDLAP